MHEYHPDGAHVVLYTDENEILLYKRDRDKLDGSPLMHPSYWSCFGGGMDDQDGGVPIKTACRELEEELEGYQLAADLLRPLCRVKVVRPTRFPVVHYFAAPLNRKISEIRLKVEGNGLGLFSHAQIDYLPVRPEDRLAIERFFQGPEFGYLPHSVACDPSKEVAANA